MCIEVLEVMLYVLELLKALRCMSLCILEAVGVVLVVVLKAREVVRRLCWRFWRLYGREPGLCFIRWM